MLNIQNVSLAALRPGHEFPGASINARKHNREDGVQAMAASILVEGVLQSLLVVAGPDNAKIKEQLFFVADGNRRLAALRLLAKAKKIAADALIPAIQSSEADPVNALRKSLAAGTNQVALHPVDQYEAFAACQAKGDTPEKIAERYALPVRIVKQRLALAELSPVIREAWRKGKLTAEGAAAYASTPHHAAQEKLFKRNDYTATNPNAIRESLLGNQHEIERLIKFVTPEYYKAAGGKLIEDLFSKNEGAKIADFGLLSSLADKKLDELSLDLVKKGWGWATPKDKMPADAWFAWPRKERPSAEEKKKLGVILRLDYNGKLEMRTGLIKPRTKGIAEDKKGAAGKGQKKSPTALSNSLKDKLESWRWIAVQKALKTDTYPQGITETLAEIAADLMRPHSPQHNPEPIRRTFKDLVEGLNDEALQPALIATFVPKDYFPRAPKLIVLKAIAEAGFADHAKKLAGGTKAAAWKFALGNLAKTGWLPPELRLGSYPGPEAGRPKKKGKR